MPSTATGLLGPPLCSSPRVPRNVSPVTLGMVEPWATSTVKSMPRSSLLIMASKA